TTSTAEPSTSASRTPTSPLETTTSTAEPSTSTTSTAEPSTSASLTPTSPLETTTSIAESSTSATVLPTTTPMPAVEHFTVNFTVTNLKYKEEMATPNSEAFNSTEKSLTSLLDRVLQNSSIGSAYVGCKVTALRPVRNGEETGMDAVCTYRNESTIPPFDRVKVYHEIVNQTNDFSNMGPYTVERYSLYVNAVLPTTTKTPTPAVEHFTVNFTVTNLKYKEEMATPDSKAFRSTEKSLTSLLDRILRNSSIGSAYVGCKVTTLRPGKNGEETGMDAVCTYRNDSTTPPFDRVKVYHEIVNQTNNFSKMGPYTLERYSLYVNGYHEAPLGTTVLPTTIQTPTPAVEHFTVNFTVTNLKYKEEMATPDSKAFNSTERSLTSLLDRILRNSSIGSAYVGCKVMTLRPVKNGEETGIDTVCTYRNDSTTTPFDRVKVYHEIVNQTNDFSNMGPYTLERYSLYVNGYHEAPLKTTAFPTTTPVPTPIPAVEHFTVNFTITNLKYKEEMATPNSETFNSTEKILTSLLDEILHNSSIGPSYVECKVTALRPVKNGDETGMDAICTYRNDSTTPLFDRIKLYHEIVEQTNDFSRMGPYTLERYSLYVNGYHEVPLETTVLPTTTQTPTPAIEHFTVNFTVTNLKYKEEMATPDSKAFNSTQRSLISLLSRILRNSSIGSAYVGCKVMTLRPMKNGEETGMDAVCTYRNDSTTPLFDRVKVYHEIVNQTNDFSEMGPYTVERYSLYVNGYHEVPLETTVLPTTTQAPTPVVEHFTVNFTVTNLKYKEEMATPNSKAFNSTEKSLTSLLDRILRNSSVGSAYVDCKVTNLRPVRNGEETGMDAVCTYRNDSITTPFDRVKVYHEIMNQTNNFSEMGPYTLERYSLYVNGYHEAPLETTVFPTTTPAPTPTPAVEHFTLNFTITNLRYKEEMATPDSEIFNSAEKTLTSLLDEILHNSSVGSSYVECTVTALRPVQNGEETRMDAICTYRNDSTTPVFDRVKVYREIVEQTNDFSQMGPYTLERYSLYVNGYHEVPPETTVLPTTTQAPTPAVEQFTVNFTVTNLKYKEEMATPNSKAFNSTEKSLTSLLDRILRNSSVGSAYVGCRVTTLRPVRNGEETGMDAVCTYRNDSITAPFDRVKVYHEIVNQTNDFSKMGPYTLERYSLYVNGYHEVPLETTVLPTTTQTPTPAVEQFTVNFTVTNLKYKEEMATPNSKAFNSTEKSLTSLLDRILRNSSVGSAYVGCRVTTLRPVRNGEETGMDAVCTYRNDSITTPFDRVKVYHEIVNQTNDFSKMGPYTLERYSLYVNGYHEAPLETTVLPTTIQTPTPAVEHFTVNFTVTNLKYKEEMATPDSKAFNSTERSLISLLSRILRNSSIGSAYVGCKVMTLRPVNNGEETGVDAVCTYRNDSATPLFDRVKVYHEIVNQTNNFSNMGPYTVERYSLYVDGYNETPAKPTVPPTTTATPTLEVEEFTVNFTVTNLIFQEEMRTPHSKIFNSTERTLITLLSLHMFSNIPVRNGDETGMDAICTYRKNATTSMFNRVKVYHELVNMTNTFTEMGPYSLERYSLYVNAIPPISTVTPTPAVGEFTVNFTVTNLRFQEEMRTPDSKIFSSTERTLITLLGRKLVKTSIGPAYLGCQVTNLRPVNNGDETGMDAVCTYRKNATTPVFDRVKVYHELVNMTDSFTKMGPYSLERYSLYVNAVPPTTTATPSLAIGHFTVNFTVTNLRFQEEMRTPYSKIFNSTEKTLTTLLGRNLVKSSIGPEYLGCQVTNLRPMSNGDETGMDAICTYRKNSTTPVFDRVKVYHELVNMTNNFTMMGPYNLERYSLYVNAVLPTTTATPTLPIEEFTVNFTVTNLRFQEEMRTSHSKIFNSTEKTLTILLGRNLIKSSIGPEYLGCQVTKLRPVSNGDETGMDAICAYRKNSATPVFDRIKVYHELVNMTNNFTKMGPYNLERYSLYVNGYNETPAEPTVSPTTTATPTLEVEEFTVNFTVTNLRFQEEMRTPHSKIFNSTERTLTTLLGRKLVKTSIGPVYLGCQVTDLRSVRNGDETGMDAICSYRKNSTTPMFNRVRVYHELVNMTKNFTKMEPYSLEQYSLYVNGYNEMPAEPSYNETPAEATVPPTTTATPTLSTEDFTVNFTMTNLRFQEDMRTPHSKIFNSTERILATLLHRNLIKSSIGPAYLGCQVTDLRPVNNGDETGMDAVCTYRKNATTPAFDRVKVYHELVNMTNNFTRMGLYTLARYSLYVNGYNETPAEATVPPTTATPTLAIKDFTVNFTVTNLRFQEDMRTPHSKIFNSTERTLTALLGRNLVKTSIGQAYLGCQVTDLRPVKNGDETGMDAVCTYRKNSTTPVFDRVKVYHELVNVTNRFTRMGPYNLKRYSLYVNGYNETPAESTVPPSTTATPTLAIEEFTMNFTVTNLRFQEEMRTPHSKIFSSTEKTFTILLGRNFVKTSIGPAYLGCQVTNLRPVRNGDETRMDAVCTYRKNATTPVFERVKVYHELVNMTNGFTKMGPYNLKRYSLYVNGYHEPPREPSSVATTPHTSINEQFVVNFTITNLRYKTEMENPSSKTFISTDKSTSKLGCSTAKNGCRCILRTPQAAPEAPQEKGTFVPFCPESARQLRSSGEALLRVPALSDVWSTTKPFPPTLAPDTMVAYDLGFTIINENLTNTDPSSPEYRALMTSINDKALSFFSPLLTRRYGSIVVDCKCYFNPAMNISKEVVKDTFQRETWNVTSMWLGNRFQLKGVTVRALDPVIEPMTDGPPLSLRRKPFSLNFTITNLPYTAEMKNHDLDVYHHTKRNVETELNSLFLNSDLAKNFHGCSVENFRSTAQKNQTGIDSVCQFTMDHSSKSFETALVYDIFKNLTRKASILGNYTLDDKSLHVNVTLQETDVYGSWNESMDKEENYDQN
ncbi:mucin-16, partial [Tiliqua scincoides]|uniref:mucin-16 n=1 Tax=Tiliqua scincoides TaxID=71010 RepID=UPI0034623961